jgi:nitroreductase
MTTADQPLESLRDLLATRHSTRAFRPDPVPRPLILQAVDAARLAPSWCNTQPWHLDITDGTATDRFRRALVHQHNAATAAAHPPAPDFPFPNRYIGAYRERRLETALRLYDAVGLPRGDRAASARQTALNFELFGAPHVAILTTEDDLGVYGAVDCGLFLGTFLLALQASGIGSIAQAALATQADAVRMHFQIPDSRRILCGVSFGWEATEHPVNSFRTSRASAAEIVTWHE